MPFVMPPAHAQDESHKAKHFTPGKESQSTKVATCVLELQSRLPSARVVYCSATGVSEVANMAVGHGFDAQRMCNCPRACVCVLHTSAVTTACMHSACNHPRSTCRAWACGVLARTLPVLMPSSAPCSVAG